VVMLLSSYLGTAAKAAGGKRQYVGVMGKADRMIYLSVASLLAFLLPVIPIYSIYLAIVLVGLCFTIVQRLKATYADLQSPR
jgi:phosphatidylglycerophosphate synthase